MDGASISSLYWKERGMVIKRCDCESKYQDERYGKGLRVHNLCGAKNKDKARCTVCGRERPHG